MKYLSERMHLAQAPIYKISHGIFPRLIMGSAISAFVGMSHCPSCGVALNSQLRLFLQTFFALVYLSRRGLGVEKVLLFFWEEVWVREPRCVVGLWCVLGGGASEADGCRMQISLSFSVVFTPLARLPGVRGRAAEVGQLLCRGVNSSLLSLKNKK